MHDAHFPPAQGLYDPRHEHDACGLGFVVHVKGQRSNAIVRQALQVLINLQHRGACGSEQNTGDGAGILIQMPDRFLRKATATTSITLPAAGAYGAGLVFLPHDPGARATIEALFEQIVAEEGQRVLGWRDVPTDNRLVGASAAAAQPVFKHIFIGHGAAVQSVDDRPEARAAFERKLYVIRKRVEHAVDRLPLADASRFYVVSLSCNTLTYKGMLTADQIETMFPDLSDPDLSGTCAAISASAPFVQSWPLLPVPVRG
jgi:glutamate synthase (ferredoxin)